MNATGGSRTVAASGASVWRALIHERLPAFNYLSTCSAHGSHDTSFLKDFPHFSFGVFSFGTPRADGVFDVRSSSYLGQVLSYTILGFVLFLLIACCDGCFFYRRYWLGTCGDPFPTVKRYSPRQRCCTMATAAACFTMLGLVGWITSLEAREAYDFAYDGLITHSTAIEGRLRSSFETGRLLLDTALTITTELDLFDRSPCPAGFLVALYTTSSLHTHWQRDVSRGSATRSKMAPCPGEPNHPRHTQTLLRQRARLQHATHQACQMKACRPCQLRTRFRYTTPDAAPARGSFVNQFVDASALRADLECVGALFDSLPNATRLLRVTNALIAADAGRPPQSTTQSSYVTS